jgi:hypothetical protein
MVLNNLGSNAQTYSVTIPGAGFPAGLTVVDVFSCKLVVVDSSGGLQANLVAGLPMVGSFLRCFIGWVTDEMFQVYYPYFLLQGTGWCGY